MQVAEYCSFLWFIRCVQCDLMAEWFVKYLAIYHIKISLQKLTKVGGKRLFEDVS